MYDYNVPKKTETPTRIEAPPSDLIALYQLFYREKEGVQHVSEFSLKGYRKHIIPWIFWLHERSITRPDEIGHAHCVEFMAQYGQRPGRDQPSTASLATLGPRLRHAAWLKRRLPGCGPSDSATSLSPGDNPHERQRSALPRAHPLPLYAQGARLRGKETGMAALVFSVERRQVTWGYRAFSKLRN